MRAISTLARGWQLGAGRGSAVRRCHQPGHEGEAGRGSIAPTEPVGWRYRVTAGRLEAGGLSACQETCSGALFVDVHGRTLETGTLRRLGGDEPEVALIVEIPGRRSGPGSRRGSRRAMWAAALIVVAGARADGGSGCCRQAWNEGRLAVAYGGGVRGGLLDVELSIRILGSEGGQAADEQHPLARPETGVVAAARCVPPV